MQTFVHINHGVVPQTVLSPKIRMLDTHTYTHTFPTCNEKSKGLPQKIIT